MVENKSTSVTILMHVFRFHGNRWWTDGTINYICTFSTHAAPNRDHVTATLIVTSRSKIVSWSITRNPLAAKEKPDSATFPASPVMKAHSSTRKSKSRKTLNFLGFFPGSCNSPPRYQWHRFDMISIPHHFFFHYKNIRKWIVSHSLFEDTTLWKEGWWRVAGGSGVVNCWKKELRSFFGRRSFGYFWRFRKFWSISAIQYILNHRSLIVFWWKDDFVEDGLWIVANIAIKVPSKCVTAFTCFCEHECKSQCSSP